VWGVLGQILFGLFQLFFVRSKPEERRVEVIEAPPGMGLGSADRVVVAYLAELQYRAAHSDGNAGSTAWGARVDPEIDTRRVQTNGN